MKTYKTIDDLMKAENKIRKSHHMDLIFSCFMTGFNVRGEIKNSNANPVIGYKKNKMFYLYYGLCAS